MRVCEFSVGYDMAESQKNRWHSQDLSHEVRAKKLAALTTILSLKEFTRGGIFDCTSG
jgi:hypothetical protein